MTILTLTLAMTFASFAWFVVLVFFPVCWRRFMDWENALSIRLGVPGDMARWMKRHETGATLKVVAAVLTFLCALCVLGASSHLK